MDEDTIRRPLLITLAALVWFVVGAILIAISFAGIVYALLVTGRTPEVLLHFFFWPSIIGVLWIHLGYQLIRGRYADVIGVCIASLILAAPLLLCGVVGAMGAVRPIRLEIAYSLASITIGTWLVLSGIFVMASRSKYRRWVQSRNSNALRLRLEQLEDEANLDSIA